MRWVNAGILIGVAALGSFGACGGSTETRTSCERSGDCNAPASGGTIGTAGVGNPGGASGSSGRAPVGGTAGMGGSSTEGAAGIGTFGSGPDASCATVSTDVAQLETDLFLMLDQSAVMGQSDNRWSLVTGALKTFLESPDAVGLGVGIGYFGLHPPGTPPSDPLVPGSCNPLDYSRFDVPIDILPAAKQPLIDSLDRHTPGGARPTEPALLGAIQYAIQRNKNLARRSVVVLITGGEPQGCTGNDFTTVSGVASAGMSAIPQIRSYVIAVGNAPNFDAVARAGGTERAYAPQSEVQIVDALKEISGRRKWCEFALPPPPPGFDSNKIAVFVQPRGGLETPVERVGGLGDCGAETGGWYFDLGDGSSSIVLCPATCNRLSGADRVKIAIGCSPGDPPPL